MSTSRTSKGQTSIEFLAMVVFMTLLLAGAHSAVVDRQVAVAEQQVQVKAASVADTVGYELDLALSQGEGYERTFELPEDIGGDEYDVELINETVRVVWGDSSVFSRTAATDVEGEVMPGDNTVVNEGSHLEVSGE